jgi:hypothetical protein
MSHRPKKAHADGLSLKEPRGKLIALLGVLGGTGVALALLFSSHSDHAHHDESPVRGLACADLSMAFTDYQAGRVHEFDDDVRRAAEVAEQSVRGSAEFGEPERIALELQLGKGLAAGFPQSQILMWLGRAQEACTRLGRWHPSASASGG